MTYIGTYVYVCVMCTYRYTHIKSAMFFRLYIGEAVVSDDDALEDLTF